MPYQNRVNPFGELVADPSKAAEMLGNRGCLHDEHKRIGRKRWTTRSWVACDIGYKGRKQTIMAPNSYTQLFFLDEATALAAGHRPCAECRRSRFNAFTSAWRRAHDMVPDAPLRVAEIDRMLHAERVVPRHERPFVDPRTIPDGAIVASRDGGATWLKWRDRLHHWTFLGYDEGVALPGDTLILLTPESTVRALRMGYEVEVHKTLPR
jgi:hypothetical protein